MDATIGLPRMHKEASEVRDFLPDFVAFLGKHGVEEIVLEDGYGSGLGFQPRDYLRASSAARFAPYAECLSRDIVIVLRAPAEEHLARMRPGAILLSMLHFGTNPTRTRTLAELEVSAISLDSIVDDRGRRLIENMAAVGWNGMEMAFRELGRSYVAFEDPARRPIHVTVLGSGAVAGAAVFAAARYGDQDLHARMVARRARGVVTTVVDHDITWDEGYMLSRLSRTDVLVDATRRPDPTRTVISNQWVGQLPDHAVILDLSADPYDFTIEPPIVKAIEGVPQGDLDHFVFPPNDPAYDLLPVDSTHRRVALSCYSWPGIHPRACMDLYGGQLERVLEVVLSKPGNFDVTSDDHLERAIARAEVHRWLKLSNVSR